MRRLRIAAVAVAVTLTVGGLGALAPVAAQAAPGDTAATFTITGGTLTITVPASTVNLGSVNAGALTASGPLGNTTVTDNRGNLVATWTVTVTSTDFTTPCSPTPCTPSSNQTVTKANVSYNSGTASSTSGTGVFTPSTTGGVTLATAGTGAAWTGGVGVNSATWNPTIKFTLLGSQVAGTYSGTLNQSVA